MKSKISKGLAVLALGIAFSAAVPQQGHANTLWEILMFCNANWPSNQAELELCQLLNNTTPVMSDMSGGGWEQYYDHERGGMVHHQQTGESSGWTDTTFDDASYVEHCEYDGDERHCEYRD
jgi:hypothetical protein